MYHMPISIELLQKGGWKNDLGLSFYWHNNIWQRYPINLYFVIDYFYSHIHTIVGIVGQTDGFTFSSKEKRLFLPSCAKFIGDVFEDEELR